MAVELTDSDALIEALEIQLSSLSSLITSDGYGHVCDIVLNELGWSFPVTNATKVLWMINRGTRHAINLLRIASANKFKYKAVNLQQRFEHFDKLIASMDAEFEAAMSSDIATFVGLSSYKMFGTKIDAGFSYDFTGADTTYDYDKLVNFTPLEAL
jgi:hypothetical protein